MRLFISLTILETGSKMFSRIRSVIKATMLEVVSEPLFFLLVLSALSVIMFSSFLHIHNFSDHSRIFVEIGNEQFKSIRMCNGETSRMARDIGLSSILIFGILFTVFSSIRVFRREIESGTLQMALSRPISREVFFISKVLGVLLATLIFFIIGFSFSLTTVVGSEIGKIHSDIVKAASDACCAQEAFLPETIWFGSLAIDVFVIVLPIVLAAILNRFARFRFITTSLFSMLIFSVVGCFLNIMLVNANFGDMISGLSEYLFRIIPTGVIILVPIMVFLSAAAAFSIKFKDNIAATLTGVFFLLSLPVLGNYYQTQALSRGASLSWIYVLYAFLAALPFIIAFLLMGIFLLRSKEVS